MFHNKDEFGFNDMRLECLMNNPGKEICKCCPAFAGENRSLRHRRKRTDIYKNHRRNFYIKNNSRSL